MSRANGIHNQFSNFSSRKDPRSSNGGSSNTGADTESNNANFILSQFVDAFSVFICTMYRRWPDDTILEKAIQKFYHDIAGIDVQLRSDLTENYLRQLIEKYDSEWTNYEETLGDLKCFVEYASPELYSEQQVVPLVTDDTKIKAVKALMDKWHNECGEYYALIASENENELLKNAHNMELLTLIGIDEKFIELTRKKDSVTKDRFWRSVQEVCEQSCLYNSFPPELLGTMVEQGFKMSMQAMENSSAIDSEVLRSSAEKIIRQRGVDEQSLLSVLANSSRYLSDLKLIQASLEKRREKNGEYTQEVIEMNKRVKKANSYFSESLSNIQRGDYESVANSDFGQKMVQKEKKETEEEVSFEKLLQYSVEQQSEYGDDETFDNAANVEWVTQRIQDLSLKSDEQIAHTLDAQSVGNYALLAISASSGLHRDYFARLLSRLKKIVE